MNNRKQQRTKNNLIATPQQSKGNFVSKDNTKDFIKKSTTIAAAPDGGVLLHKKIVKINGMRFGIWLYFVLFSIAILAVMWLFQFVFAKTYLNNMRMNDIKNLCDATVKSFNSSTLEKSQTEFERLARSNGFNIYLFGKLDQCLFGCDSNGKTDKTVSAVPDFNTDFKASVASLRRQTELNGGYDLKMVEDEEDVDTYAISYAVSFGDNYVFFAYVPQFGMQSTMQIMAMQLLIVTVVVLLVSFVAAALISSQISRPIEQMAESSIRLSKGDYSAHFVGSGYVEIDDLSDSLNNVAQELKQAETVRRDVMANVSHDLRTPLTLIRSYAEMIRDLSGDNKQKREKHLNTIINETERLTTMVNDILKYSKNENVDRLNLEVYDISTQLNSVVTLYREGNKDKFTFECDIEEGLKVNADKQRMSQVFNNFFSNAVKYSGDSTVIRVVLKSYATTLRFDIFDYGIGISEEEQPHIWDRYTKASIKHQRGDSNGIGLSIVKTILVKHNANYGVNSLLGKGSDFYFEMPLAAPSK